MAKPSESSLPVVLSSSAKVAMEIPKHVSATTHFLRSMGVSDPVPDNCNSKDFYSDLVRDLLKPERILRGRVTCLLTIKPAVTNFYGSLHGGAVAAVAETVSTACARTVVAEDKEIFLGELSISYLSGAPRDVSSSSFWILRLYFDVLRTGLLSNGRGDSGCLCIEERKKFDFSGIGVQAQENRAVSLHSSSYLLQHAHCQAMKCLYLHFLTPVKSIGIYIVFLSFIVKRRKIIIMLS